MAKYAYLISLLLFFLALSITQGQEDHGLARGEHTLGSLVRYRALTLISDQSQLKTWNLVALFHLGVPKLIDTPKPHEGTRERFETLSRTPSQHNFWL